MLKDRNTAITWFYFTTAAVFLSGHYWLSKDLLLLIFLSVPIMILAMVFSSTVIFIGGKDGKYAALRSRAGFVCVTIASNVFFANM